MKILSLVLNQEESRFIDYLESQLKILQDEQFDYELVKEVPHIMLQCSSHPSCVSASDVCDTFRHYFSTALAEFIVEEVEEQWIRHMIQSDYGYIHPSEIDTISHYCRKLLVLDEGKRDEQSIMKRKGRIFDQAYTYLEHEKVFHLDGFMRFRLKEYEQELTNSIEYAIDEYVLDQEYEEFIRLLRYFVSVQESRLPLLHIFHVGGRQFLLFNEEGEQVSEQQIEHYLQAWTTQTISYEDLIISTLVAISPKRLIVHTVEPSSTVIQTMKSIFERRVTICTQCSQCKHWRGHQFMVHT